MCVLLVEDEILIREIMAECLVDAGYEVIATPDGGQAVALIEHPPTRFSVLVTDFHMPGSVDGAEVAAKLRSRLPEIPVIIATGRPEVLQAGERAEPGYKLLKKPYLPSELVALVQSLAPPRGAPASG